MTLSRVVASLLVLCAITFTDRGAAQELKTTGDVPPPITTYLVPLLTRELPGANGSLWSTRWTVLNPSYQGTLFVEAPTCADDGQPCPDTAVGPRAVVHPTLVPRQDGGEGAFVYLPQTHATSGVMSLRVRDLSKNAQSFGTEIPVVHEAEYTSDRRPSVWLLDVPTDPQYRATLRIYGRDESSALALVRIMLQPGLSGAVEEHWLELPSAGNTSDGEESGRPRYPSYVQFDPLTPSVRAGAAGGRVTISVHAAQWDSTISPPPIVRIWAFLSITDNASQQVTVVTPHF